MIEGFFPNFHFTIFCRIEIEPLSIIFEFITVRIRSRLNGERSWTTAQLTMFDTGRVSQISDSCRVVTYPKVFSSEWSGIRSSSPPPVFLPWLRSRLEKRGVILKRTIVRSLADLRGLGHNELDNATSFRSVVLKDVQEKNMIPVKQQNIRIRKPGYDRLYVRRGDN